MSCDRKHFCESTMRVPIGCGSPSKNGTIGCMPEPVNSVVGSFSGTSDADGIIVWPRSLKKLRYAFRISCEVIDGKTLYYVMFLCNRSFCWLEGLEKLAAHGGNKSDHL